MNNNPVIWHIGPVIHTDQIFFFAISVLDSSFQQSISLFTDFFIFSMLHLSWPAAEEHPHSPMSHTGDGVFEVTRRVYRP